MPQDSINADLVSASVKNKTPEDFEKTLESTPLEVLIRSKNKIYYKGKAHSVSSANEAGPFDVLSAHTNFITLVRDFIIIDFDLETRRDFKIDRGVLKVSSNKVDGFIGI